MSTAYMRGSELPACCRNCVHLDSDAPDEYSPSIYFCLRNQIFPTKKLSCKAQKPWTQRKEEPSHG